MVDSDSGGLIADAAMAAAAPGGSTGNALAKDSGKLWAAAAAACTVAERDNKEVGSGGAQGATLPLEGPLCPESA